MTEEKTLADLCEQYTMELQTDSLRDAATHYINQSIPYSHTYYKAYQFLIVSAFNAKQYDQVINQIDKVTKMPQFANYPDLACHYQYTRSRALQYSEQINEAIDGFKACLAYDAETDSLREAIRRVNVNALLQMMNAYQVSGNTNDCVNYLSALKANPTPIIRDFCMRDLNALLAYSMYRNGQRLEGEALIEETLKMPLYNPTPEREFRDYSYGAAIIYGNQLKQDQAIEWCKVAMKAAESYKYIGGVQWLTTLLGSIYQQMGKVDEAVILHNRSIELARERGDLAGEANAYNSLTNLYLHWELYDHANEYADLSLQNNLSHTNRSAVFCGDSYLMKGRVMARIGHADSAAYYWEKADSCYQNVPYSSARCEIDRQFGTLYIENDSLAKLGEGMDRLRRLSAHADSWNDKANACFYLAKGYFKQNQHKKGELMLDSMYTLLQSSTTPYMLEGAYPFGLDYYLKKGDAPNIERYAKAMLQEVDIRFNEQISKKVTEAMIAFQTEKKEQQLRLTQAELTNKELRVQQQLLLLILLLIILTLFTAWFFNKRRLYRVERQLSEQRIAGLLSDFQTATSHSQQIEQQLSELLSDKENYLQAATITPQLFRESGENKFRERFSLLYPAFLQTLRERVPNITNNEEILSMLIVLEQSTDQMVDILCIARGSVNMARHRLRQKMGLQKEESLDDVIRGLLSD